MPDTGGRISARFAGTELTFDVVVGESQSQNSMDCQTISHEIATIFSIIPNKCLQLSISSLI